MELLSWLLSGAALVTLVLFFKGFRFRPRLNRPPGPKPWPIIGNLNLISSLPHLSIHDLSQKYGPIMQLQFGSFPVVVGSSVEMAEQFLKDHDLNFSSRPKSSAGKYTAYDHNDMLWSPYGVYWRYARKIFFLELFSMKRLDSYEYIRAEELRLFLNDLYTSCGNPITLRHHISSLTLNNITRMILGKKYLGESDELKKILEEWLLLNGVLNIGDLIPWINFLDLQGYVKRMKALRNKIDHFLEHALEEHIAKRQDHLPKDMLEVLLQLSADNPKPELKLSRNQVKALTLDLLAGGTDATAITIEWAMSEVLKQPQIYKQVTAELDRVIGRNRWVEEKDIPNLPYLKCIVKETMRMHPLAPMLAPHFARKNCKIQGYDILQGTRVLIKYMEHRERSDIVGCTK
ncbi:hypothetical protein IFM89_021593 [Coptis chinensis]|uniref:Uncharacterized protein n=1 Tax=Coptis chinensis TaxID=261450 RepID=A0A835M3G9_9MAGN|nr:hypothetical protein IFM89_021593 [Coptis chinensis]